MISFLCDCVFFFFLCVCGDFRLYAPIRATLHLTQGVAPVVKALVLKVCFLGCKQFFRATPPAEKSAIYLDPCRETFEDGMDGFHEIS